MADDDIQFGDLGPEGLTNVRTIRQSDVQACPHFILVPEHYRDDGSCRCDDPEATEMADGGYVWIDGAGWLAPDEAAEGEE